LPASADADGNGLPDSPFATLGAGDMWADDGVMVLRADGPTPIAAGAPYVVALGQSRQRRSAAYCHSLSVGP